MDSYQKAGGEVMQGEMLLKVRPVSVTTEGRAQFSGISVGEPPVQLLKHIYFHIGS